MTSSLEILILALIEDGFSTPYDLRRAGISVGAAHPTLQRLARRKLVTREKAGSRGKSAYRLTELGRKSLATWPDLLAA